MGSIDTLILNAISDTPETAKQIGDRIGIATTKCYSKLKILELYGFVQRCEDVFVPSCGHFAHTWRRAR